MKIFKAILCRIGIIKHVYEYEEHGPIKSPVEIFVAQSNSLPMKPDPDDKDGFILYDHICINCGKIEGFRT